MWSAGFSNPPWYTPRKGHVLSVVFPKYIRSGTVYRYLKIEHAGENIHTKYNRLEKKHNNQKNRSQRFFLVIRDLGMKSNLKSFRQKRTYLTPKLF